MPRRSNKVHKPVKRIVWIFLAGTGVLAGFILYIFWDFPSVGLLSERLIQPSVRITDRNGRLLYDILPAEGGRHTVLSFTSIPQCMKDATLAVEDKNFYQNPGVDLQGILRALWINLKGGETLAGGSTITQQVARTLLMSYEERTERSLRRKLREMVLAWQLTRSYSKDEILALYLNQIYYGGMAYGVEAASQTYFGKPASDLLLPECALLAGLPQTPGLYNPFTNPDLALARQRVVLGLMEKQGIITHEQRLGAEQAPLSYNVVPYPIEAPHFIWLIKDQLDVLCANGRLNPNQSLVVRTTLDLDMQHLAAEVITRHIESFEPKDGGISHNVNNAALVVIDPDTGEILALVGSADYFDAPIHGALNMAISSRQTGSAFKPIFYASALDPGRVRPWTAASPILDVSTTFLTHDGSSYTPVNYDHREHGYVSLREALASSLNIPAVKTLQEVGIENALNLARRLGITSLQEPGQYDLSLALGGGEVSLLELSTAYAALANEGAYTGSYSILDIHDADGNHAYTQEKTPPVQVIDPRLAWLISDILSDDAARTTGFGRNSTLKIDRLAAVKTGTTTNFHDNWTIGYTPDLLVGVWVGNSNYEAMHNVTGLTGAAPIWHDAMRAILKGRPDQSFERPGGLIQVEVCDLSGLLPTPACPHTRMEWFIEGTQPVQPDTFYQQAWIDSWTNSLATDFTPPERRQLLTVLDLPLEAQAWARAQGLPLLADYAGDSANTLDANPLILVSPTANTKYRIDPTFDLSAQQLSIEAIAGQGFARVEIWLDGNLLASFPAPPYQTWWTLSEGEHHLWVEGVTPDEKRLRSEAVTITVVKN
jgi:penicillin-binding protein 1C